MEIIDYRMLAGLGESFGGSRVQVIQQLADLIQPLLMQQLKNNQTMVTMDKLARFVSAEMDQLSASVTEEIKSRIIPQMNDEVNNG